MSPYVTKNTLEKKTKSWLKKIEPYNQERMALNPGKAALMIIDMQNFFLKKDGPALIESAHAFLPLMKELIAAFRESDRPIIFTKHVHHPERFDAGIMEWWWADMCMEGSLESEVYQVIAPRSNEKIVQKHRYSAFYNTDLETVLRCLKIEDLVISGVMTNMCCESTARDAYYRDYRVFFLADGTATINEEMHLASLLNLAYGFAHVTTIQDILQKFQKRKKRK